MIIVNISGGLGNQMFQYAFGKAISIEIKKEVFYCIDSLSSYDSVRRFDLENAFNLVLPRANHSDISNVLGSWRSSPNMRRILARFNNKSIGGQFFFTEKNFCQSHTLTSAIQDMAYFHGYWQSENFFQSHEKNIRNEFVFRGGASNENKKIMMRIRSGSSIALHVRRGDYVTNSKANALHGVLGTAYYFSAIASLRKRVPQSKLFIFTDDPEWVQAEIVPKVENSECVNINSGGDSYRDMQLMAMCDHNIVANSSFSWWSAWLNPNPKKIVIAPRRWFSNELHTDKSLIPNSWERM